MIGRIQGMLIQKSENFILVDIGGLAYEIEIPLSTYTQLDEINSLVTIHTHMLVREDAQLLYGFYSLVERTLFKSLIKVNKVGPKLAIAILSGLEVSAFCRCVRTDDVKVLVAVPGVGNKTAEKIIIEMRDRLPALSDSESLIELKPEVSDKLTDAETALTNLGFRPVDAAKALALIEDKDASVENLLKQALKLLS